MEVRAPNFHSIVEAVVASYENRPMTWNSRTYWSDLEFNDPDVIKVGNAYCCTGCCGVLYYGTAKTGDESFPHHKCHQQHNRFNSPILRHVKMGRTTDLLREGYAIWLSSLADYIDEANSADDIEPYDARVISEGIRTDKPIKPDIWKTALDNQVMTNATMIHDAMMRIRSGVMRFNLIPNCFLNEALHAPSAITPVYDNHTIFDVVAHGRPARLQPMVSAMPVKMDRDTGVVRITNYHTKTSVIDSISCNSETITSPILGGCSVLVNVKPEPTTWLGMPMISSGKKAEQNRNIFMEMQLGYSAPGFRTMVGLSPAEAESRLVGHHRTMLDSPTFISRPIATAYGVSHDQQTLPPRRHDFVGFTIV
ncbi:sigma B [Pycnonotidae orthoreovirus]|uniref:Sigma B n=1 Tax=Pycnonotidae orthoreovirus TaxID=3070176 RepID=A0A0B6VHD7_9REOV|nr:sigma B [Avian orthoreovirus]BAQ19503.1 sigma B [Avian orthoreovirus]